MILVQLEPIIFVVQAHSLQISLRHGLGSILGHFVGALQSTLNPCGFLVVKKESKCDKLLTS